MESLVDYYENLSDSYDLQRSNTYFRMIEELELGILRQYTRSAEPGPLFGQALDHSTLQKPGRGPASVRAERPPGPDPAIWQEPPTLSGP